MSDIRLEVVDLLIDCPNFSAEAFMSRTLEHEDGRTFTDEEHQLVGSATVAEVQAMVGFSSLRLDYHKDRAADMQRLLALTGPYWIERPSEGLAAVRAVMPAAAVSELDDLVGRLWPGEVIA